MTLADWPCDFCARHRGELGAGRTRLDPLPVLQGLMEQGAFYVGPVTAGVTAAQSRLGYPMGCERSCRAVRSHGSCERQCGATPDGWGAFTLPAAPAWPAGCTSIRLPLPLLSLWHG